MTEITDLEGIERLKKAFTEAFGPGVRREVVAWEVLDERKRQHAKWGERNYPDGTGRPGDVELAAAYKAICKANTPEEDNFRDILAEEVFEAFAETDPDRLRAELIQASAVAQQWIEAIDRRAPAELNRGGEPK